ncbi:hypothetical protein DSO57_1022127 [Entomophthora muscae]|uniref:Uncharacterized protein n=1 Tax=Entomophthora muscae TaxID=34485 RepID=A0ACC2TE77_9FUNG|nr:hypothetical protein DSO57_1022127 [Entomophthora muscae]
MELWTKICILALCSLWYFSAVSPPLCFQGQDLATESFQARHSFNIITVAFHFMGWSGQTGLLISFFAIHAFLWGGILFIDLYLKGRVFFTGVQFLPPFSETYSIFGIPLILFVAFTPSAYWAMSLSNILFNTTCSPPYTDLILDTSDITPDGESVSKESTTKGPKKKGKATFSRNENQEKELTEEQLKEFLSDSTPKTCLFQQKASKATSPFDISIERARYATIDTLFFLPFICLFDFFIQDGGVLAYPEAPLKMFGVPSTRVSGYIVVPFCAFLLYRHLEAASMPSLTYHLSTVSELRTLKIQMVILTFLAYGSQVYWIYTLLVSSKRIPSLLIPQAFPLVVASLRFIFSFLDGPEEPIPIADNLSKPKAA